MREYTLRYTKMGLIYIGPEDDCDFVIDAMLASGYSEEFCIALDWDPLFITRLMKAGFLVMSETIKGVDEEGSTYNRDIVFPRLHMSRSALFFKNLHVKRSIKPYLSRYNLRFDTDFSTIMDKCLKIYGVGWLTPSLVETLFILRPDHLLHKWSGKPVLMPVEFPLPVSFSLYRNEKLVAGEFGVICGRVYTSYSGYREEKNAGTVQMILMIRALEEAGFDFFDFGMPLDYKTDLGAMNITPKEFVFRFRAAQ